MFIKIQKWGNSLAVRIPKSFELQELKALLAGYFAKKAVHDADSIWKRQNLSNDYLEQWLNKH